MTGPICRCGLKLSLSFAAGDGSYEPCHACRRTAWQQGWHSRDADRHAEGEGAPAYRVPWDGQMSGLSELQVPAEAIGKTITATCAKCGRAVASMWDYRNQTIYLVPCMYCYFQAKSEAHADLLKSESLRKLYKPEAK